MKNKYLIVSAMCELHKTQTVHNDGFLWCMLSWTALPLLVVIHWIHILSLCDSNKQTLWHIHIPGIKRGEHREYAYFCSEWAKSLSLSATLLNRVLGESTTDLYMKQVGSKVTQLSAAHFPYTTRTASSLTSCGHNDGHDEHGLRCPRHL